MVAGSKYSGAADVGKDLYQTLAGANHGKVYFFIFAFFFIWF